MKNFLMISLCMGVLAVSAQRNEKDVLAIREVNNKYTRAVEAKDSVVLKSILAEEFVITAGNGTQRDRKGEIADLIAPEYKVEYFRIENEKYITYPHAVVVTGMLNWKMINPSGQEVMAQRVFTSMYTRINNEWRLIAQHIGRPPR